MPSSAQEEQAAGDPVAETPSIQAAKRERLSLEVTLDLVLGGVLFAGLSFLARDLDPGYQRATLFSGLVGGALCVLWGVLGRLGTPCHGVAMVTLAAVACVFARQVVKSWEPSVEGESKGRMVLVLMTVLVMFCLVMLANLVREKKNLPS